MNSIAGLAGAVDAWRSGRAAEAERLCRSLLARDPACIDGHRLMQELLASGPRWPEAIDFARTVVRLLPGDAAAHRRLADLLSRQGDVAGAIEQFERSLKLEPLNVRALNNLGNLKSGQGELQRAAELLSRAVEIRPDYASAHANLGLAHARAGRLPEAIESLQRALRFDPRLHEAWLTLAGVYQRADRHEESLECYDRAASLVAPTPQTLRCRAEVLLALKRPAEAFAVCEKLTRAVAPGAAPAGLASLRATALLQLGRVPEAKLEAEEALTANPDDVQGRLMLGLALLRDGAWSDSLVAFDRALLLVPGLSRAHAGRAGALEALGRTEEAIEAYQQAASLDPTDGSVFLRIGMMMLRLGSGASALDAFDQLLARDAGNIAALEARAMALMGIGRHQEALEAFSDLEKRAPTLHYLSGYRFSMQLACCDWRDYERSSRDIDARVLRRERVDVPLSFLAHSVSPESQRVCAEIYAAAECAAGPALSTPASCAARGVGRDGRLRVGYLSFDFRNHPVAQLMAGVFEAHDRTLVETYGYCAALDDGSELRRRLESSFDRFEDVCRLTDEAIARRIAEDRIDILVDLGGHTLGSRTRVLAFRPAPIQISMLGYPGTIGADFVDYIIADRHVVPESERQHYSEQVIIMPVSYLPGVAAPAATPPDKHSAGLPAEGVVFCGFNSPFKITPAMFALWMRLLTDIPAAVLWLRESPDGVKRNLAAGASGHGVDPSRLIYAPRTSTVEEHQRRLAAADVFLDTYPYNAHTTACESLAAAVPVVTMRGRTFASRVATSLVHGVGLGQLSVDDPADYHRTALELAENPAALAEMKRHLRGHRARSQLFDASRYCRDLEAAFREAAARHARGQLPAPIDVEALSRDARTQPGP